MGGRGAHGGAGKARGWGCARRPAGTERWLDGPSCGTRGARAPEPIPPLRTHPCRSPDMPHGVGGGGGMQLELAGDVRGMVFWLRAGMMRNLGGSGDSRLVLLLSLFIYYHYYIIVIINNNDNNNNNNNLLHTRKLALIPRGIKAGILRRG